MHARFCAGLAVPLLAAATWSQTRLASPNGAIELNLATEAGQLAYSVTFHGRAVVLPSKLGLELAGQPVLGAHVRIVQTRTGSLDETYSLPFGKSNPVRNVCRTAALDMEETAAPRRELR